MVEKIDKRREYINIARQFGIHPDIKITLNKNYSFYFNDLLPEILLRYNILEVKHLDDDILYTEEILYRGL